MSQKRLQWSSVVVQLLNTLTRAVWPSSQAGRRVDVTHSSAPWHEQRRAGSWCGPGGSAHRTQSPGSAPCQGCPGFEPHLCRQCGLPSHWWRRSSCVCVIMRRGDTSTIKPQLECANNTTRWLFRCTVVVEEGPQVKMQYFSTFCATLLLQIFVAQYFREFRDQHRDHKNFIHET